MSASKNPLAAALADRYRIERELGEGGMATVYLAHDVRHDRKVALKVLRPELAAVIGADRFLAEIKTTANLQHPHILALYDSGQVDGRVFYVMPYVEGESLRDRLNREKQLPLDDALRIAREIAGALDYAHRHGVIHRDIKPENIMLHEGQALVADFGIALAASTTAGTRMTETGMSLGTPTYMSPEQAMGERTLDARTDIYALGCVLYEMLAGEPPFTGPTAQAVVARVLTGAPESLVARRHTVPPHVEAAVETALEKLPADRFATAAQFADALVHPELAPARVTEARPAARPAAPRRDVRFLATLVVAAVAVILAAWGWMGRGTGTPPAMGSSLSVLLPDSVPLLFHSPSEPFFQGLPGLIISPDGRQLVYVTTQDTESSLAMRAIGDFAVKRIPGTEGAFAPFFSPDGAYVGFFTRNELRKVRLSSGEVTTIMRLGAGNAAAWSPDDRILVSLWGRPLRWVSASGGNAETAAGSGGLVSPSLLPGNEYALGQTNTLFLGAVRLKDGEVFALTRSSAVSVGKGRWADSALRADIPDRIVGGMPRYVDPGYLTWITPDGLMMVAPFDAKSLTMTGPPEVLASGVRRDALGTAQAAVAPDGTLAYVAGDNVNVSTLGLVDSTGRADTLKLPRADYNAFAFSPDGRRLAVNIRQTDGTNELWVYDLDRALGARLLSAQVGGLYDPVWSPDGSSILIAVNRKGGRRLLRVWPDRPGQADTVAVGNIFSYRFLPDGREILAGGTIDTATTPRLWVLAADGKLPPRDAGTMLYDAEVSPDGRWLTYSSGNGVTVEPYPRTGEHILASDAAGGEPSWSPSGNRIFYRAGSRFYSVAFHGGHPPSVGAPRLFVEGTFGDFPGHTFAVGPDGRHLLLKLVTHVQTAREIRVVTGAVRSALAMPTGGTVAR